MTTDRTYWHVPGARSWHGDSLPGAVSEKPTFVVATLCGRRLVSFAKGGPLDHADRIPPNAHLCGSCARVIAARTDHEQPDVVYP